MAGLKERLCSTGDGVARRYPPRCSLGFSCPRTFQTPAFRSLKRQLRDLFHARTHALRRAACPPPRKARKTRDYTTCSITQVLGAMPQGVRVQRCRPAYATPPIRVRVQSAKSCSTNANLAALTQINAWRGTGTATHHLFQQDLPAGRGMTCETAFQALLA